MKRLVFASLAALIGLGAVLLVIRTVMAAPTNEDVAQRFNQKKKIYEQLREMLIEDNEVRIIAPWGVRTTTPPWGRCLRWLSFLWSATKNTWRFSRTLMQPEC